MVSPHRGGAEIVKRALPFLFPVHADTDSAQEHGEFLLCSLTSFPVLQWNGRERADCKHQAGVRVMGSTDVDGVGVRIERIE